MSLLLDSLLASLLPLVLWVTFPSLPHVLDILLFFPTLLLVVLWDQDSSGDKSLYSD